MHMIPDPHIYLRVFTSIYFVYLALSKKQMDKRNSVS